MRMEGAWVWVCVEEPAMAERVTRPGGVDMAEAAAIVRRECIGEVGDIAL